MEQTENNGIKGLIGQASVYTKTYFQNPYYLTMPEGVLEEIKLICAFHAEKLHCNFGMRFKDNGDILFETSAEEWDYHFDDIGAKLELDRLAKDKRDFFKALKLWHTIYVQKEGNSIPSGLLKESFDSEA